jgi:hypothetical protein
MTSDFGIFLRVVYVPEAVQKITDSGLSACSPLGYVTQHRVGAAGIAFCCEGIMQ